MLQQTIQQIIKLNNVRPSETVNSLFAQLVDMVVSSSGEPPVSSELKKRIQAVAADAEAELEKYWANKIIESVLPHSTLQEFPYTGNYKKLVSKEISLLEMSGYLLTQQSKVLIIGSGPLPMTAFEMTKQRNVSVDHVDISPIAITLSQKVGEKVGVKSRYILGDGATFSLRTSYDVIVIAGLAGDSLVEKQRIIDNLLPSLTDDGRMLVRSARGARELLYPAVCADDFIHMTLLSEYHPSDDVINSIYIYKKEEHV